MENVKVLGASDRNVKALKMAMTIKGPETKNGKAISDMQLAELPAPVSSYPFKMSIKNLPVLLSLTLEISSGVKSHT